MTLLNMFRIVIRVLCGMNVAGFFVGLYLHEKHKIFKKIFDITGCAMIWSGMMVMWYFTVLGF